jgi:exopolysaccharide biosynthesis polyprenyl glycosylphosphotransferase
MTIEYDGAHRRAPDPAPERSDAWRSASAAARILTGGARSRASRGGPQALLNAVRCGDGVALFIGFAIPLLLIAEVGPHGLLIGLGEAMIITAVGLWSMRFNGLWTSQVMAVRSIEVSRAFRALVTLSVAVLVLDRKSPTSIRVANLIVAGIIGLVVLVLWRSAFRAIANAERRRDRFTSRVILVGTGRQSHELSRLFAVHPELGMRVVAVIGSRQVAATFGMANVWKGTYEEAKGVLATTGADVVMLCASELDRALVNEIAASERQRGRQVYVDPGLSGLDFRRMHTTAIGHQPLLEMTGATLSELQVFAKRTFDIVVSGLVALLALPAMALAAALIKLEDGGPVLFRQERVGRDGKPFGILKFRTMVTDAEARLAALRAQDNERHGPLFKLDRDPRVTRIGRFLRATSLDELPQVFNVLGGTMSLVGPRPALPSEVAEFPAELLERHRVRPGISGLWQVEARDNPSFEAYSRLDLFYVQNWSLTLDLVILLATVDHICFRPLIKVLYRREDTERMNAAGAVADEGVVAA